MPRLTALVAFLLLMNTIGVGAEDSRLKPGGFTTVDLGNGFFLVEQLPSFIFQQGASISAPVLASATAYPIFGVAGGRTSIRHADGTTTFGTYPAAVGDLDCSDVDGPVFVGAFDPHGLDRDQDGIGCE